LGLPVAALSDFGLGADPHFYFPDSSQRAPAWTWREYDAQGNIIGVGGRRQGSGEKGFRKGGRRGLILTVAHAADRQKLRADIIARGRVLLAEGASDSMAVHAMGEVVVGRPSVSGGVIELTALLNGLALPEVIEMFVLGENDKDTNGHWPGRDQALEVATKLASALGPRVVIRVIMPPAGIKDLRAAWQAGFRTWEDYVKQTAALDVGTSKQAEMPDTLRIPCGCHADCCSCPDSCVQTDRNLVRTNRDKATIPQYIRKQSAKYSTNPWDCPSAFGVAGEVRHSPALIPAVCRQRDCPVCGPRWRQVTFERFGYHIDQHVGPLFTDCIPDVDWQATLKAMRRESKASGVPLRFVAIRDEEAMLTIISSIASSPYATEIDKTAAVETLQRAVDAADLAPRPFSACRAWGKIDTDPEPEDKAQRVPGGASPAAFAATLGAWGAEAVTDRGAVHRCSVDNLFLDPSTGQTDGVARADFWREAELYTACGPDAAAEFRERAAKRRRPRRDGEPPAAATCQHPPDHVHDWKDTPTGDGRKRRACTSCGEFFGYVQAEVRA
jgi:hypothetical protein